MSRESVYGTFKGVNFYGVSQLSFLYWCDCQDIAVENNSKELRSKDGKLSTKPIFYLPTHELIIDVRPRKKDSKKLATHTHRVNTSVSENNPEFIFMYQEKLKTLSVVEIKYLIETRNDIKVTDQVINRLSIFHTKEEVKPPMIGMPRWFRDRLRTSRKSLCA